MSQTVNTAEDYPRTAYINGKCINIVAGLWHTPEREYWKSGAVAETESEMCVLAMVAAWHTWRKQRLEKGLSADRPNIVISGNHSPLWEHVAKLWNIELRPVDSGEEYASIDPYKAVELYDENSIRIIITASKDLRFASETALLVTLLEKRGIIPQIHIDAATEGLKLPFEHPDLSWDFRCHGVVSISAYEDADSEGLFPGKAWLVWRDRSLIPDGMTVKANYLGLEIRQIGLNFSRPITDLFDSYARYVRTH